MITVFSEIKKSVSGKGAEHLWQEPHYAGAMPDVPLPEVPLPQREPVQLLRCAGGKLHICYPRADTQTGQSQRYLRRVEPPPMQQPPNVEGETINCHLQPAHNPMKAV